MSHDIIPGITLVNLLDEFFALIETAKHRSTLLTTREKTQLFVGRNFDPVYRDARSTFWNKTRICVYRIKVFSHH